MFNFFRRLVMHNFWLKVLSLALATGLWFVLAHDPVAEVAVEVPIVFRNVPANLVMNYERIPRAQIQLSGPQRAVRRLQSTDVHAEIDMAGGQPGDHTFAASAIEVHRPHDLQVINVGPDKFHVTFVNSGKAAAEISSETHP
jgi:hypothetical protein